MFFCVPILFGSQTTLKARSGQQSARICPRCNNVSVIAAKSTTWFELFWVPLVPFSKKHIWFCSICQWQAPMTGSEPNLVVEHSYSAPNAGLQPTFQPGYAPTYIQK